MHRHPRGPAWPERLAFAAAALFSGVALLAHILWGAPLPLALATTAVAMLAVGAFVVARLDSQRRTTLGLVVAAGAFAGITATIVYDGAKWALSQVDPSPYDPFEATRAFGIVMLGAEAPTGLIQAAGVSVHLLNGTAFGVAFATVAGSPYHRRGTTLVAGVAWGLILELFQLALYPGWLDIRAYREFATISALSHVVYGATLGLTAHALLRRLLGVSARA